MIARNSPLMRAVAGTAQAIAFGARCVMWLTLAVVIVLGAVLSAAFGNSAGEHGPRR